MLIEKPPSGRGSGKFRSAWARMHRAAVRSALADPEPVWRGAALAPHPATRTLVTATTAT